MSREIVKVTAKNKQEAIAALKLLLESIEHDECYGLPINQRVVVTNEGESNETRS